MKFVEEFRSPERMHFWADKIDTICTKKWKIMEVCGGQTHSLMKYGIDSLFEEKLEILHGPGCPVCVTPAMIIDQAIALALTQKVILATYGDMLRVPGDTGTDLWKAKAQGADVRVFYSPLDAVALAREYPEREIVFLAIGFETTAPAHALAVLQAAALGVKNFSLLLSHVLVPPALATILEKPDCSVQGFLAAGHVCTIMGTDEYQRICDQYSVPIVVTGFEPVDLLEGIYHLVSLLESGRAAVVNQYARSVETKGNPAARAAVDKVFRVGSQEWRGMGCIESSGLKFREAYQEFDAAKKFHQTKLVVGKITDCESGRVLVGEIKPPQCKKFGKECRPENPLGATMVSAEGACRAYFEYREEHHARL